MTYEDAVSRCWLEVDLDAIAANYRCATEIVGDNAMVIPVLKANAYGMNAVWVAERLMREGARLFAVATADEAEQLLNAHPNIRVLPLGLVSEGAMRRLIDRGLPLTLYSAQQGRTILRIAQELGKPAPVHIKIDTGLHRLGFDPETAADEILELCKTDHIIPLALYTHLALHTPEADDAQFEKLCKVQSMLAERGLRITFMHAVDSIGMVHYPGKQFSAARCGAWLYGVRPGGELAEQCRGVARFKARISQLHRVARGELIGYDDDHPVQRDTIVATVSAGYIDGTPRRGNGWMVEVRSQLAPVLGLACMDQLMIDVTDIPGVCEHDEVTFVGGMIEIEAYARMGNSNHNEAWARIGRRVPRIFYENGKIVRISAEL